MKIKNLYIVLLLCIAHTIFIPCTGQVRLVLSAAISDAYYEIRKQQYIASFHALAGYGYSNPYVVEALRKQGPTFLDDYSTNVFYSTANAPHYRNKGISEALTLLEGFYHFGFHPDDIIIKMTGRYLMVSDYLLRIVENHPEYDAIVKVDSIGQVHTLAFAMRCKYFQEMFSSIDYPRMETLWINIEREVGDYIRRKAQQGNFKVLYLPKLDIKADLIGSAVSPGAAGVFIF